MAEVHITIKNNTVPLPPGFETLKAGDRVRLKNTGSSSWNGREGVLTNKMDSDRHVVDLDTVTYLTYWPRTALEKIENPKRVEGEQIAHKDVRKGDIIKVELVSETGNYRQVSSKQGKVDSINVYDSHEKPTLKYHFITQVSETSTQPLNYGHKDETITLIKAVDPEEEALKELKALPAGSVYQLKKDNGEILTFIRPVHTGLWTKYSSKSVIVDLVKPSDMLTAIKTGAKLITNL